MELHVTPGGAWALVGVDPVVLVLLREAAAAEARRTGRAIALGDALVRVVEAGHAELCRAPDGDSGEEPARGEDRNGFWR